MEYHICIISFGNPVYLVQQNTVVAECCMSTAVGLWNSFCIRFLCEVTAYGEPIIMALLMLFLLVLRGQFSNSDGRRSNFISEITRDLGFLEHFSCLRSLENCEQLRPKWRGYIVAASFSIFSRSARKGVASVNPAEPWGRNTSSRHGP